MGLTYFNVNQDVSSKGCKLLTTLNEWNLCNAPISKKVIKIVSKCGHSGDYRYDLFRYQNNGVLCRECSKIRVKTQPNFSQLIESNGYNALRNMMNEAFDVVKLVEGTHVDFAIRPKGVEGDKWLGVQLKVSERPKDYRSNGYVFSIKKRYSGYALACVCVSENKAWIFDGDDITVKSTLCIGQTSRKHAYAEYNHDIARRLYATKPLHDLDTLNMPLSKTQQTEHLYRLKREQHFTNTQFQYPDLQGRAYDFIVHNKKVQEKVATKIKEHTYIVCINRCNRRKNFRYNEFDNDVYWFHIPNSELMYIIPTFELVARGHVAKGDEHIQSGTSITLTPYRMKWSNAYLYDYSLVNDANLIDIINGSKSPLSTRPLPLHDAEQSLAYKSNTLGHKLCKKDEDGHVVASYASIAEAAQVNNIPKTTLTKWLRRDGYYKSLHYMTDSDK